MSFSDFGSRGPRTAPPSSSGGGPSYGTHSISTHATSMESSGSFELGGTSSIGRVGVAGGSRVGVSPSSDVSSREYAALSDAILQYQRNIGILGKIVENIGIDSDADTQYKLQTEVISQLSSKIEQDLSTQEQTIQTLSRTDATQSRATHIKLTRDYRRVEASFKNIQLEHRRKVNARELQRRMVLEEEQRREFEEGVDQDAGLLQMQLRDDRVNEEIMREREEEIRNINRGMHQVNEIYKDLAHIVGSQQEQIDDVEDTMEQAQKNTESGLQQIEKAKAKAAESSCVIS